MVRRVIEQLLRDTQQMLNRVLQERATFVCYWWTTFLFWSPESATSLIFFPSVFAIKPITENMTKPLIKQVPSLKAAKISVSLKKKISFYSIPVSFQFIRTYSNSCYTYCNFLKPQERLNRVHSWKRFVSMLQSKARKFNQIKTLTIFQNYRTADVFSFDKSGMNKYLMPSMAPSSVKPRMSKMNKSKYGNIDVKYTTLPVHLTPFQIQK